MVPFRHICHLTDRGFASLALPKSLPISWHLKLERRRLRLPHLLPLHPEYPRPTPKLPEARPVHTPNPKFSKGAHIDHRHRLFQHLVIHRRDRAHSRGAPAPSLGAAARPCHANLEEPCLIPKSNR